MKQVRITLSLIKLYRWRWLSMSLGFTIAYFALILIFTMIRFENIPNYVATENVFRVYAEILAHTPSVSDALQIMSDEAFFETGFKDPNYYGIATWSYSLMPSKIVMVFVMAMLLVTFLILKRHTNRTACLLNKRSQQTPKLNTIAGIGTTLISLTNISLSWVACCAVPNWSVALTMLGLSSSISLWLNPYGKYMTVIGLGLLLAAIIYESRYLSKVNPTLTRQAN
jgi:hypothetical protein